MFFNTINGNSVNVPVEKIIDIFQDILKGPDPASDKAQHLVNTYKSIVEKYFPAWSNSFSLIES